MFVWEYGIRSFQIEMVCHITESLTKKRNNVSLIQIRVCI